MARQQIPRWFGYAGWAMVTVGLILLVRDLAAANSPLEGSIGGIGLVIDLAIDVFLVVAGGAVLLAMRRDT